MRTATTTSTSRPRAGWRTSPPSRSTVASSAVLATPAAVVTLGMCRSSTTSAKVVKAKVPLSEMFGYIGDLRSSTAGRANFTMVFDSYAEVPSSVAQAIIDERNGN